MARQNNSAGQRRAAKVKSRAGKTPQPVREEPEDLSIEEFVELICAEIVDAVTRVLVEATETAAVEFSEMVTEIDEVAMAEDDADSPPGYTVCFLVLDEALGRARERAGKQPTVPDAVREWIAADIGAQAAHESVRLADLLAAAEADTPVPLAPGDDVIAAFVLVAAGYVVAYGDGDVDWLELDAITEQVVLDLEPGDLEPVEHD